MRRPSRAGQSETCQEPSEPAFAAPALPVDDPGLPFVVVAEPPLLEALSVEPVPVDAGRDPDVAPVAPVAPGEPVERDPEGLPLPAKLVTLPLPEPMPELPDLRSPWKNVNSTSLPVSQPRPNPMSKPSLNRKCVPPVSIAAPIRRAGC